MEAAFGSAEGPEPAGAGTVLVVEDDTSVRATIADHLRDQRFEVLEADNADAAIDVLNERSDVALVFSDVRMPGSMDGFGLADWIRRQRPALPVILTSGYVGDGRIRERPPGDVQIVPKPYRLREVAKRIRNVLKA